MTKYLMAIVLLVSTSSIAKSNAGEDAFCDSLQMLAQNIMIHRQGRTTSDELLAMIESMNGPNTIQTESSISIAYNMVSSAYALPKYDDYRDKEEAVNSFAMAWLVKCVKARD